MALTLRAAAGPNRCLRRLFSTGFVPPVPSPREEAEPCDNLFVSGLNKRTTSEGLHKAFASFGEVVQARVVTDRVSGFSKGFGFVKYATLEDAAKGKQGMDGQFLDGWVIFAEYARPRSPTPPPQNNPTHSYRPSHANVIYRPTKTSSNLVEIVGSTALPSTGNREVTNRDQFPS